MDKGLITRFKSGFNIPMENKEGNLENWKLFDDLVYSRNFENLIEIYLIEEKKGNPLPIDCRDHFKIFQSMEKYGNEELRRSVNLRLLTWKRTLSNVIYKTDKSQIIHYPNTSKFHHEELFAHGKSDYIANFYPKELLGAITGIKDIISLENITKYLDNYYSFFFSREQEVKEEKVFRGISICGHGNWGRFEDKTKSVKEKIGVLKLEVSACESIFGCGGSFLVLKENK